MTRITWIAPTDEMSLKVLRLLPKTQMRKNPPTTMVVRDEHVVTDVERETTTEDTIPMMIIGESDDVRVVGTMIVPLTHQIQAVRVDHIDPLDSTGVDHHMIVMSKDHVIVVMVVCLG